MRTKQKACDDCWIEGTNDNRMVVKCCPLHAAAGELLRLAKIVVAAGHRPYCPCWNDETLKCGCTVQRAEQAISNATKGGE